MRSSKLQCSCSKYCDIGLCHYPIHAKPVTLHAATKDMLSDLQESKNPFTLLLDACLGNSTTTNSDWLCAVCKRKYSTHHIHAVTQGVTHSHLQLVHDHCFKISHCTTVIANVVLLFRYLLTKTSTAQLKRWNKSIVLVFLAD